MALSSTELCWLCASTTSPKYRIILNSEANSRILDILKVFVAEEERLPKTLHGEIESKDRIYVCRGCFTDLEKYRKLDSDLQIVSTSISNKLHSRGLLTRMARAAQPVPVVDTPPRPSTSSRELPTRSPRLKSPPVKCIVGYKRSKLYSLTPSRKRIGKSLARRQGLSFAKSSWSHQLYRTSILKFHRKKVNEEVKKLCSSEDVCELRNKSIESMTDIEWEYIYSELASKAPLLMSTAEAAIGVPLDKYPQRKPVVCMSISILLFSRNKNMSLIQRVIAMILFAGHTSKNVYTRLNRLGLCLSYQQTQWLLDSLGENHDKEVLEWSQTLESKIVVDSQSAINHSHPPSTLLALNEDSEDEDMSCFIQWLYESDSSTSGESENLDSGDESHPSLQEQMISDQFEGDPNSASDNSDMECEDNTTTEMEIPTTEEDHENESGQEWCGFKCVGDNIDKNVKPRFMRIDKRTKSLHYFNSYAVKDRVDSSSTTQLDSSNRSRLDVSNILPNDDDLHQLTSNCAILLSRVLVDYVPLFNSFQNVVTWHIQHEQSMSMRQKSVVIPLGVQLKNEQTNVDMIDIMDELHRYVPKKSVQKCYKDEAEGISVTYIEDHMHRILLGGDQLTCARARSSQRYRMNAECQSESLLGLIPCCEDWHAKVTFLSIIWKRLYKSQSFVDAGSLYHLRNTVHRSNVTDSPKENFNACEEFFLTAVHAHIAAASMQILGMNGLQESPTKYVFPDNIDSLPGEQKKNLLQTIACDILSKYFFIGFNSKPVRDSTTTVMDDGILEYGKEVLSLGMLYLEFRDAIKEGDGLRVLRCWKYLLLLFKASQRKNYSLEAFNLLCQFYNYLPPTMAQQLLYSRFVNVHGREGCNIPCDLHMEHLNRTVKESMQHLGANKTEQAIVRASKCSHLLNALLSNFDHTSGVHAPSGSHSRPSDKADLERMITVLCDSKVFSAIGKRAHKCFHTIECNGLITSLDKDKLIQWMHEHFEPNLIL